MTIKNKANRIPPVSDGTAAADAANNTTPTITPPPSDLSCIRLDKPRGRYSRNNNDGLDWLRQPSNDLPAGAVSLSVDVGIPDGAGGGFTTMPGDELYRQTQEKLQEDRMLSDRFGFGNDPYSQPSGLSVRGRSRSNNDNDSSDSSSNSSGLSV